MVLEDIGLEEAFIEGDFFQNLPKVEVNPSEFTDSPRFSLEEFTQSGRYRIETKRGSHTQGAEEYLHVTIYDQYALASKGSMQPALEVDGIIFDHKTTRDFREAITLHKSALEYLSSRGY